MVLSNIWDTNDDRPKDEHLRRHFFAFFFTNQLHSSHETIFHSSFMVRFVLMHFRSDHKPFPRFYYFGTVWNARFETPMRVECLFNARKWVNRKRKINIINSLYNISINKRLKESIEMLCSSKMNRIFMNKFSVFFWKLFTRRSKSKSNFQNLKKYWIGWQN